MHKVIITILFFFSFLISAPLCAEMNFTEEPLWQSREVRKKSDGTFDIADETDPTIWYNVCQREVDPYGAYDFDRVSSFWENLGDSDSRKVLLTNIPPGETNALDPLVKAMSVAQNVLSAKSLKQLAETAEMTNQELLAVAAGGYFDQWQPGVNYRKNKRLMHEGRLFIVAVDVTSQDHLPPGSAEMSAVYRPVETEAMGTVDDPITFSYGMDAYAGLFYSYSGLVYECKVTMVPSVMFPGAEGVWQWELVKQ